MSIPPLEHLDHIGSFLADLERLSEFSTSLASERGKVVSQISGALLFDGLTGSLNDTNRHTNIIIVKKPLSVRQNSVFRVRFVFSFKGFHV